MTAKQVLNAKAGQKLGLGNGLRCVCDARNGARYFELRKRVRGKDYSKESRAEQPLAMHRWGEHMRLRFKWVRADGIRYVGVLLKEAF